MKKIEFVRLTSTLTGFGLGKGTKFSFEEIEDVIKKRMEGGWEYSGFAPITTRGTGSIETLTLIFQKDE